MSAPPLNFGVGAPVVAGRAGPVPGPQNRPAATPARVLTPAEAAALPADNAIAHLPTGPVGDIAALLAEQQAADAAANESMSFLDSLTDFAGDAADVYKTIKGDDKPAAAPKPAAKKDNTGLFIGLGAGALVLVLVLVLVLKK